MKIKDQKVLTMIATGLLFAVLLLAQQEQTASVSGSSVLGRKEALRVVIDAGHGGIDPGKIGINGAEEKDVNLEIALLVKRYLEQQDVEVIMTRETEEGLYDADADNKKVQDMKRRIEKIDGAAPALTVSIHQNSYPEEYVKGAQVFYYTGSEEGQRLAELLQKSLVERLDPENHRQVKANDSYYLLKKTATPIVIVECGFLSNGEEAQKLCSKSYQERVAWAVHVGILQYLYEQD
ncbi:MAG: N-acetylmuramoyl-L-alanine amidase [Muribaculum sp.]|nr:N-acetylmuramoyl-L-alanine amidase [Muribaculum sp.]